MKGNRSVGADKTDTLRPGTVVLERMERAVQKVRSRLLRAAAALENAQVPYAVIGGNAVAAWVATVDESAVRNTRDVDFLIERKDFDRATAALESAGFVHKHAVGVDVFLDGPGAKARDAVHVVFAGEKVRPDYEAAAPDIGESARFPEGMRVISLSGLVRMKLTSYRLKDRMHLQDLIDAGLVSNRNMEGLPRKLAGRLRESLENREE